MAMRCVAGACMRAGAPAWKPTAEEVRAARVASMAEIPPPRIQMVLFRLELVLEHSSTCFRRRGGARIRCVLGPPVRFVQVPYLTTLVLPSTRYLRLAGKPSYFLRSGFEFCVHYP